MEDYMIISRKDHGQLALKIVRLVVKCSTNSKLMVVKFYQDKNLPGLTFTSNRFNIYIVNKITGDIIDLVEIEDIHYLKLSDHLYRIDNSVRVNLERYWSSDMITKTKLQMVING